MRKSFLVVVVTVGLATKSGATQADRVDTYAAISARLRQ